MNLTDFLDSEHTESPHLLLVGKPVTNSLSPLMHNTAAEFYKMRLRYYAVKVEPEELDRLAYHFTNKNFRGANVTIPHKEALTKYVDELVPVAKRVGALNTIMNTPTHVVGFNTDVFGFILPIKPYQLQLWNKKAIVFGTGGAARAIVQGLNDMGISEIIMVSRQKQAYHSFNSRVPLTIVSYNEWQQHAAESKLIVNATPLGMTPHTESSPVKEHEASLLSGKICYDIVYKPLKTKFLRMAEEVESIPVSGLNMLIYQASESFGIWTGRTFPIPQVKKVVYEYLGLTD